MRSKITGTQAVSYFPALLVAMLLLATTWEDGAFDVRYWAPIAVLALGAIAAMALGGAFERPAGMIGVALVAIWTFAGWTLLSALWSESAAAAVEGGLRTVLYAAAFTLAVCGLPTPLHRRHVAFVLVGAVGVISIITLIELQAGGADLFLAGRLDQPLGYRNATASLFGFAFWPLICLAAVRGQNAALRSGCFAVSVVVLGLAFLTQSRGVVIGLFLGGVICLAVGPDRLRRAWIAIAAAAFVALAAGSLLAPYHEFLDNDGVVGATAVDGAARTLLLAALGAAALGLFAAILDNGDRRSAELDRQMRGIAAVGLAGIAVFAVVAGLASIGNPISYASDKVDEFTELEPAAPTGSTRLGSVGGQRYDLWRVGLGEFADHPLGGVGERNYVFGYYQQRRTDRNLDDPHSLPVRLLAETGVVGFGLFTLFAVALASALTRALRMSSEVDRRWIAALAAAGASVFVQTSIDFLWLFPTLTGVSLMALGLAASGGPSASERVATPGLSGTAGDLERERRELPASGASFVSPSLFPQGFVARFGLVIAAIAAISATCLIYFSDLYARKARSDVAVSPRIALDEARTAGDLNPLAIRPLYLEASALETLGDRDGARQALERAHELEPNNFVTLGLLGDLEVRAGDLDRARDHYAVALQLNPLDTGLRELSRDP